MLIRSAILTLFLASVSHAQFTCTLTNQDESACLDSMGDDSGHCVWCNVAGFGVCVSEDQAETMEQSLPGTECDRYSGNDDDTPSDDDAIATDDNIAPTDDSLPDDFWTCLQKKDSKSCIASDCTWCDSDKFGFGLCMTGPTADSASESDFFTCSAKPSSVVSSVVSSSVSSVSVSDPQDTACALAYLMDPTPEGCASSVDSEGNACEYCNLAGVANLCLTEEQAEIGGQYGITCDKEEEEKPSLLLRGNNNKKPAAGAFLDPFDTACLLAFMQDPSEEGCEASVDSDGMPCEFCSYQGTDLCLNQEQAQAGEQFGMECSDKKMNDLLVQDPNPYDPSCALAFLQDQSKDTCLEASDQEGNACKYCQLQGALNLCLTEMQAQVGEGMGIECDEEVIAIAAAAAAMKEEEPQVEDVLDTSCLMAFLNAGGQITPDACAAAVDSDGNACEFCSIPGIMDSVCVTQEQSQLVTQFSDVAQCGADVLETNHPQDPYDPSCALAFLQNPTADGCKAAVDSDGEGCEFCDLNGSLNMCLNAEQAAMGASMGITCDYEEAGALEKKEESVKDDDVSDPSCLIAQLNSGGTMTPDECSTAVDQDGNACEVCSIPGVTDVLCLTSTQAEMASQFGDYVQCGKVNTEEKNKVDLPPDFFDCMEEYEQSDCNHSGCTWCNTEVGVGMCMSSPAARAMSECNFFSCDNASMSGEEKVAASVI